MLLSCEACNIVKVDVILKCSYSINHALFVLNLSHKCAQYTEPLMGSTAQLVVILLWSLVEVHSQTAPYISFMGETLPNHAYANLSLVGDDDSGSDSVQCHTDLFTCCTPLQGQNTGDWYHPDMTIVSLELSDEIYVVHRVERVDLHQKGGNSMSGIYRCDIETIEIHSDDPFDTTTRATVYVGLYTSGGTCTYVFWYPYSCNVMETELLLT